MRAMGREAGALLYWWENAKTRLRLIVRLDRVESFSLAHFLSSPRNPFVCYTSSNNSCEQLLEGNRWEDSDKFLNWKQSKRHTLRTVSSRVSDKIEMANYNDIPFVGQRSHKLTKQWLQPYELNNHS